MDPFCPTTLVRALNWGTHLVTTYAAVSLKPWPHLVLGPIWGSGLEIYSMLAPLQSLSFPSESLTRSYELLSILALLRDLSSGHRGP